MAHISWWWTRCSALDVALSVVIARIHYIALEHTASSKQTGHRFKRLVALLGYVIYKIANKLQTQSSCIKLPYLDIVGFTISYLFVVLDFFC